MDIFALAAAKLAGWWNDTTVAEKTWLAVGFSAQLLFSMRFVVQWLASERARRSIVPEAFWYFSLAGGALLLAYAIYRVDPVFILGQGMGLFIYARNVQFIRAGKRIDTQAAQTVAAASE
jgi:lipid-A-disaccharide synthase-like uncharacterized protein